MKMKRIRESFNEISSLFGATGMTSAEITMALGEIIKEKPLEVTGMIH